MSIIFLTYAFYEIPNSITYFHYFLIYRYPASLFPLDKMYTGFVAYITPLQSTLTTKMPYVMNYCRLQPCLYFDITDLLIPQGTVIPWTHPLLHFLLVIVLMPQVLPAFPAV